MSQPRSLTSSGLLARNVAMNMFGWGLPAIAALVALPILLRSMGDGRFGMLTLAWTTLGYFSLFDLGIGRALTHAVAAQVDGDANRESAVVWTALSVIVPLSVIGAGVLFAGAPFIADRLLHVPEELRRETEIGFRLLAVAIPFTASAAALRGVLEAKQRFGTVNALRIPYGLLTFLGPLAALPFSNSLVPAIGVLVGGRVVLFVAHVVACVRVNPALLSGRMDGALIKPLVTFGGWMTVTNVVSPLMNTMDRFVVGAVLSVSLVTYYATPHELVTKMWLFTAALLPVVFPAFATSVADNPAHTSRLFDRALRTTFAALFLPTLALVMLGKEILTVWLGAAFAEQSTAVMQVLAVAVFVNTIGQCALTLIQALGRPDLTGKYHLVELPIYAALLAWLLPRYGILGVAMAWAIRAIGDSLVLVFTCPRLLRETREPALRILVWLAAAFPVFGLAAMLPTTTTRAIAFAIAAPAWVLIAWWRVFTAVERAAPTRAIEAMLGRLNEPSE